MITFRTNQKNELYPIGEPVMKRKESPIGSGKVTDNKHFLYYCANSLILLWELSWGGHPAPQ